VSVGTQLVVALGALAVLAGGCSGKVEGSTSGPSASHGSAGSALTLSPECPAPEADQPKPTVEQVNAIGAAVDLPAWQAGDIGASGRLDDGRLVWLFGDTIRPKLQPQLVANSMLISSGKCVSQLLDEKRGPVIPDVSASVVRWPMSVVIAHEGDREGIVVFCSRIDRGDSGDFGFTFLGTSVAVFSVEDGGAPQLVKVVDITPDSRDQDQVNWGAAATIYDGWYYVYGTRLTGQKLDFGRELYVARAPASDPSARKKWQFWDGSRWQSDVDRAKLIVPSQDGVSQTLSVDHVGNGFVAVSKLDGDISNFVYKWTAPDAWGPWTPVKELKAPGGLDTGDYEYAPLAHPEIPLASGDLLVSISRNTNDFQRLLKDPKVGRPFFVQLPR
jgi:hypothetical protein